MQVGLIGLGRIGSGILGRLLEAGHSCTVFDRDPEQVRAATSSSTGETPSFETT